MQMPVVTTVLQQCRARGHFALHAMRSFGALRLQIGVTVGAIGLCVGYVLLGTSLFAASTATLRYVAPGGSDSGDCARSDVPCATPQYAVDVASSGDEIRVAAGTYTGVQARHGVTQTLYLSKTLTIRGGYSPTNWTTPDPHANPTILDAQRQGRVVSITGSISPTLEGLWFTNGAADREGEVFDVRRSGGGVLVVTATVTLRDNWIMTNQAFRGGGLSVYAGTAHLRGNTIAENRTTGGDGGGVYLLASTGVLTGNTIISNTAAYGGDFRTPPSLGGGLYAFRSAVTLTGNTVVGNSAFEQGGGVNVEESIITMTENVVAHNGLDAAYSGRGVGGGVFLRGSTGAVISNTVSGNRAGFGGGIRLGNNILLKGNTIADNAATSGGGGVYLIGSGTVHDGNVIVRNDAYHGGGVLMVSSSSVLRNTVIADNAASSGSGAYVDGGRPSFVHTTVARNRDASGSGGSGVYIDGIPNSPRAATLSMTNTILVSHTVGLRVTTGNTVTLTSMLWFGNGANASGEGTITLANAITGDPAFAEDGYHLTCRSAALGRGQEAGTPIDLDGEPRPPAHADLGADQFPGSPCHSVYLPLLFGP